MANYYVVGNDVDTSTVDLTGTAYEGYTVIHENNISNAYTISGGVRVGDGDNVVISGSVDEDVSLNPAAGESDGFELNVTILDNTHAINVDVTNAAGLSYADADLNVTVVGSSPYVSIGGNNNTESMTVTVADGASIGDVTSGTDTGDNLTLTAGDGARVGDVVGGDGDDSITLGNDVTIGGIDLNGTESMGDTITAGNNVTVNGSIEQDVGDSYSLVEFGDDATINGDINLLGGQDKVTLGDNASVTGYIQTGSDNSADDADSLVIGANSTIDSYINTNAGNDTITIGDNTSLNGGFTSVNTYLGDDSVTLGDGIVAGNYLRLGGGSDTVVVNGSGSYIIDQNLVTPNDDLAVINYGAGGKADFEQALADQGFTDDDGDGQYTNGSNSTFTYNGITYNNTDFVTGIACFAAGTMIETDRGAVAIEDLAEGDLVMTRDNGAQPIRWIGSSAMSAAMLEANDKLRPIRIRAGALGEGLPAADLLVSPQHRILVRSKVAQKMFGASEVLVAAKQLLQIEGIDIAVDMAEVTYFHMLFDQHEVVISNGAETESLYTGPEALKSVGPAALEEIFAIFPELADRDYTPVAARILASGRMGRKLAVRHAMNRKALVLA